METNRHRHGSRSAHHSHSGHTSHHPRVIPQQWHHHQHHHHKQQPSFKRHLHRVLKHHKWATAGVGVLALLIVLAGLDYQVFIASRDTKEAPPPQTSMPDSKYFSSLSPYNKVSRPGKSEQKPRPPVKKQSDQVLQLKVKDGSNLSFENGQFSGSGAEEINMILSKYGSSTKSRVFRDAASKLKKDYDELKDEGQPVADLSQYYKVKFSKKSDIAALTAELGKLSFVQEVYAEPLPAPAPTTPNYLNNQGYRKPAPLGTDANFASSWPGGAGDSVRLFDVEYAWNSNHEDLSKARLPGALVNNGTPYDPFNDNNHGTAVLGVLSGDSNNLGVTGAANQATIGLVNANSTEFGWDLAGAIYTAANRMEAGDVLLIEQQTWGPTPDDFDFVPVEWIPSVYDAIRYATALGVIVIEPGGNGNQNLDNQTYYGTSFPAGKPDSGAIIVGAGAQSCTGSSSLPALSRLWYSNYGARVNVQGWGECVVTTGYGDLWNLSVNELYTATFNGTSSASAVIASAAASFSSAYEKLNSRAPSPDMVRSTLESTGTAQSFANGSQAGSIGPLPNLAKALKQTDLVAPSAPGNLNGIVTNRRAVLNWTTSTDNVGIAQYKIYRNNALIATVGAITTYTDTSGKKGSFQYKVQAVDKADKLSAFSNTVTLNVR